MKKLENLNKEKFLLEPQKMGELVGGAIKTECTGGRTAWNPKHGWNSSDYTITYTGKDIKNGILSDEYLYWGANDVARRNEEFSTCACEDQLKP